MFCRSGDVTSVEDPLETFVECTKSALVVSEVFCLPKDYRKDVPPPSKMLSSSAIDKLRLVSSNSKLHSILFNSFLQLRGICQSKSTSSCQLVKSAKLTISDR